MLEQHCYGALTHLGTSLSLLCYSIVFAWTHKVSFGFSNWIVIFFSAFAFSNRLSVSIYISISQIGYHFL